MTFGLFNKENWFKLTKISIDKRCPKCGSKRIRRSHRYRWIENVLRFFRVYPFRCNNYRCQRRFLKASGW